MALLFNLRHLEEKNLHLKGEMAAADLEVAALDEMIHANRPLSYDLEVQQIDQSVLVQGSLALTLDCECVRCLKPFKLPLKLDHWACHIPLEGEDKAAVVSDCVDLTPYLREDIVLAFPQHPLCEPECSGLAPKHKTFEPGAGSGGDVPPSPWAALDKLKL